MRFRLFQTLTHGVARHNMILVKLIIVLHTEARGRAVILILLLFLINLFLQISNEIIPEPSRHFISLFYDFVAYLFQFCFLFLLVVLILPQFEDVRKECAQQSYQEFLGNGDEAAFSAES